MKKYIVIALIVLVGGALLIGPLMNGGGTGPVSPENGGGGRKIVDQTPTSPAYFTVRGNVAVRMGSASPIEITVSEKNVTDLSVSLDGTVLQSWMNPDKNFTWEFLPNKVGTYALTLDMTTTDGTAYQDRCSIRILADGPARQMQAVIANTYPHSQQRFTQGLEFNNGKLFESTGLNGKSRICEVDLKTGEEIRKIQLDGTYFGEGITMFNDVLYQLTWRAEKCFTYDFKEAFVLRQEEHQYLGEGWGLCNDGSQLIMSNGTEYITFRDPETFQETRKIQAYTDEGPVTQLNELEYINGKIYANVYMTNAVVVIDPATGKVLEAINCESLALQGRGNGDVLNGIAHNPVTGKTYMTGKNWTSLFEVTFTEVLP